MAVETLTGRFHLFFLFDVAEELNLSMAQELLGHQPARSFARRAQSPEYVRFAKPPLTIPMEPLALPTGERLDCRVRYFDYGVASVELQQPFSVAWERLISEAARWVSSADLERLARERVQRELERLRPALVKPNKQVVSEDYTVIFVESSGAQPVAAELIAGHGGQIAQIVRAELLPLSPEEQSEILTARLSYYTNDLIVAGWSAAFVYDTAEGAAPTIEIFEYVNSQLLEFRYYDEVLTRLLKTVYQALEKRGKGLVRWRLARQAEQLNQIRLEVTELTDGMDNSIKFLGDMFSARLYRLASARIGVTDYRGLVEEKLNTAKELYEFMTDQFHHGRAFALELMVVIILLIELYYLFRGH